MIGDFGWSNSQYRFSEYGEFLRVVSTDYNELGQPQHQLSIFRSDSTTKELTLISQLPNEQQPQKKFLVTAIVRSW
ncbi:hypothetical protein [Psychrobium sp. 1_MG-2023]|uniref:hypothetical protein n=1 Tax=Psychrobium sp. 1_MG-2023 TaxID=3062624 RepID=UPI000C33F1DB|nr:hypothetical protein [Psychrobium sp. 1_MG-2023]MDP2561609.1 hypothetical protein [Psychrobium sp. 1_MG-2023]PKF55628.1 hypothetical protein CW748_12270 [Alteromonadales bacterium alter-6D02]